MSAIVWADVLALAPELSSVSDAGRAAVLAYVNQALNPAEWGGDPSPQLRLARIYLAAHYGSLSARGASGASGPVTSESAGGLSRSYAVGASASAADLESTAYGATFRALCRSGPARAWVVL